MVVYPNETVVRDYFSWRQADTHINNLYNTTFWALVLQGGRSEQEATKELEGTFAADKNEILHSRYGINYEKLEPIFRKGTTLVWTAAAASASASSSDGLAASSKNAASAEVETEANEQPVLTNPKDEKLRLKIESKRAAKEAKKQEKRDKKAQLSVLRTLHCDIISDEFWVPAPSSSASTIAGQTEAEGRQKEEQREDEWVDIRIAQPWSHPSRFNGAGLGFSVFID